MDEFWKTASQWLWGVLVPMMFYFKQRSDNRIDAMETEIKNKADKEDVRDKADRDEMDRQRNNIDKLFDENNKIRRDMNGGFERITSLIHNAHTQVMGELAKKADRRKET